MDLFLVFYGYLSISFGWIYYLVVFLSLGVSIYSYIKSRDLYLTAEKYIKSLLYLGTVDLTVSGIYALIMTLKWIWQNF